MGSGIILIRRYIEEPSFEHYFEPIFKNRSIGISNRHFFGELVSDKKALLALEGDVTKDIVYNVMSEGMAIAEKDNEENNFRRMHESQRPEWYHLAPTLMDEHPKIIGLYSGDKTASNLFESVGLEYVSREMERGVSRIVDNMAHEIKRLGNKFSKF
ncbi:hypothetical protein HN903_03085 [archaeon]|jgi:hypothetical protein|nr:hypothetical protein [archaeon]MBT6956057.1 hypothetical protein [archaeon]MBT7128714.1 hypothetical protein [archaeon]